MEGHLAHQSTSTSRPRRSDGGAIPVDDEGNPRLPLEKMHNVMKGLQVCPSSEVARTLRQKLTPVHNPKSFPCQNKKNKRGPSTSDHAFSPFKPGNNTMNRSVVSKEHVKESRGPLGSGRDAQHEKPQPARRQEVYDEPPRTRIALEPPVTRQQQIYYRQHQTLASSSQLPPPSPPRSRSSSVAPPPLEEDFELLGEAPTRRVTRNSSPAKSAVAGPSNSGNNPHQRNTRSTSPRKPPSSDARDIRGSSHQQSSPTHQEPPRHTGKGKGKAKEGLSAYRPYHEISGPDSDSDGGGIPPDDIKNPNGFFNHEMEGEVEFIEHNQPEPRPSRQRDKGVPGRIPATDDPPPPSTNVSKGLKSAKRMQRKDGNVRSPTPEPARTPARAKKQDHMTTIPSSLANQERSADIDKAWVVPNHLLKCHLVKLEKGFLKVVMTSVGPAVWCNIGFDTIDQGQICNSHDHPFMMLTLRTLSPSNIESIENMSRKANVRQGPIMSDLSRGTDLCIELTDSPSSVELLQKLKIRMRQSRAKVFELDLQSCLSLRTSCNVQSRDTRAQARTRNQVRRQSVAESERSDSSGEIKVAEKPARSNAKSETQPKSKSNAKDKEVEDPNQSKLNFVPRQVQEQSTSSRRKSQRLYGAKPLHDPKSLRDSGPASIEQPDKPISQRLTKAGADKNDLMFAYPPTGKADVNVTYGDAQRVESGEFLNDTLLEFGLRHVLRGLHEEIKQSVHLFNSFFYDKLSNKTKKSQSGEDKWPAYETVKKWTKGKNIFEKKFVIVPINENYHWYLAVIVNPAGVLRRQENPSANHDKQSPARADPTVDGSRSRSSSTQVTKVPFEREDTDLNDLDSEPEDNGQDPNVSMMTEDPLDCIDQQTEADIIRPVARASSSTSANIPEVSQGVRDLSLEEEGQGAPIWTPTMAAVASQNDHSKQSAQPAEPPVVATTTKKGKPRGPDAEIWGSRSAWILTFDSLGGPHKAVANTLNAWLKNEAKDKLQIDYELEEASYWEGRVPIQNNFSDCGLYLVHYAKQLLERPEVVLSFVQIRPYTRSMDGHAAWDERLKSSWRADETCNLREQWCDTMIGLATEYNASREQARTDPNQRKENESEDEHDAAHEGFVNGSQDDSIAALPASQFQREQQQVQHPAAPSAPGDEGGPDQMEVAAPENVTQGQALMPGAFPVDTERESEGSTKPQPRSESPADLERNEVQPAPPVTSPHEAPDDNPGIENDFDPRLSHRNDPVCDYEMPAATHTRFPSVGPDLPHFIETDEENEAVEVDENMPFVLGEGQIPTPTLQDGLRSNANATSNGYLISPEKRIESSTSASVEPYGPAATLTGSVRKRISQLEPTAQFGGQDVANGSPPRKNRKVETEADLFEQQRMKEREKQLAEVEHLRPARRQPLGEIHTASDSMALSPTSPISDVSAPLAESATLLSPPDAARPPLSSGSTKASEAPGSKNSPFTGLSRIRPQASSPTKPIVHQPPSIDPSSHPDKALGFPASKREEGEVEEQGESAEEMIILTDLDPELSAAAKTQNRISARDALNPKFQDTPSRKSKRHTSDHPPKPVVLDERSDADDEEEEQIEERLLPAFVSGSSPLGPVPSARPRLGMGRPRTYSVHKVSARSHGNDHARRSSDSARQGNQRSPQASGSVRRQPPGHRQSGIDSGHARDTDPPLAPVFTRNHKKGIIDSDADADENHTFGRTASSSGQNKRPRYSTGGSTASASASNGTRKKLKQTRHSEGANSVSTAKLKGRDVQVFNVDSGSE
ncbi:hypothetical protein IAU59_005080 [Kwoniella sp. CBS 9459]